MQTRAGAPARSQFGSRRSILGGASCPCSLPNHAVIHSGARRWKRQVIAAQRGGVGPKRAGVRQVVEWGTHESAHNPRVRGKGDRSQTREACAGGDHRSRSSSMTRSCEGPPRRRRPARVFAPTGGQYRTSADSGQAGNMRVGPCRGRELPGGNGARVACAKRTGRPALRTQPPRLLTASAGHVSCHLIILSVSPSRELTPRAADAS